MQYSIGTRVFKTKKAAEEEVRDVLKRYGDYQAIPDGSKDFELALALLRRHQHSEVIIGCGVAYIRVEPKLGDYNKTFRRFLLERTDYSIRDFGWRRVFSPKSPLQMVARACRHYVQPQRDAASEFFFATNKGPWYCAISGERIFPGPGGHEVDHVAPITFEVLVDDWLAEVNRRPESIEIVPSPEYEMESVFAEFPLRDSWIEYHRKHATLRVISRAAHRHLPKPRRRVSGSSSEQ